MNEASTTWALVVGIDQYDSPSVPPLQGAVADVLAAVAWLRKLGVPDQQILLNVSAGSGSGAALQTVALPYASARQADIAASIYRLSLVVAGTRLLVFLCGHGFYEPSSGRMFLVQDFDTNGQWPNLGIDAYVQVFLSMPFRRQFLFMDGCLNYPYPETMRQRFQAMGPVGGAPVTPRQDVTMVTCFAASVSERALERDGRGMFLSSLLPQLDPADPVPAYRDALAYGFDQGTRTVDLYRLMDRFITQQVRAATGGAQNPRVFIEGAGGSVDGAYPLYRVLPDPDTVTVLLTVDPAQAAVDIQQLRLWIDDPPFPSKDLYQPPPLQVPVLTRLLRGAEGRATCTLPSAAPWDIVSACCRFTADADQTVSFTLTRRSPPEPAQPPGGPRSQWLGVKITTREGAPYGVFTGEAGYDKVADVIGLPESPADGQSVADGVTVKLHEDGPEFTAEPGAAITGAETAAVWAEAVRTVLPELPIFLPKGLQVTTLLGDVAPKYEKLHFQFPPGGARQLAGPLASHPAVVIERGPTARPPAWRWPLARAREPLHGVETVLSLSVLEQQPGVAIEPGPVRIGVELPWGSWTLAARVPASGIEQIELPTTIGVPPLRVVLADDLPYLADRDRSQEPMIVGLEGDAPEATLVSLLERNGTDPAVVVSPSASASWSIPQPGLHGILRLGGLPTILFPLAGRSLAVDRADGLPRVEPLSATSAAEWDLLIGTGQLEVLETDDGLNLAREADDELLRLASAYMLYARREWLALGEALLLARGPRQVGQLDEALLRLAVIHSGGSSSSSQDTAMDQVLSAAKAGQVPVLRWGIDLALTVLTAETLGRSSAIATWHAALAAIRPRLSARSVWTAWTETSPRLPCELHPM